MAENCSAASFESQLHPEPRGEMMFWRTLGLTICLSAGWLFYSSNCCCAQTKKSAKTPGELLPGDAVFYLRVDGTAGHEEAYEQTAAYQALEESGLMSVWQSFLGALSEEDETAGLAGITQHLQQYGGSLAIAVDAPEGKPVEIWGTAVAPFAAEGAELLGDVLQQFSKGEIRVRQTKVQGRVVHYIDMDNPLVELGWWEQGQSLVLAFGMHAIANSLAVAEESRPNITSHPLWENYSEVADDFEVTQLAWFDARPLIANFGDRPIPIPNLPESQSPPTVNQVLEILGLHSLEHAASLTGYRGDSLWTEILVEAPGPKTGLLTILDQPAFQIADLPAMPLHHSGIMAISLDTLTVYEAVLKIIRELVALNPQENAEEIDEGLEKFHQELGFTPEEFLGALGSLHCLYSDSSQSVFGLGSVVLCSVDDQDLLTSCLRKLLSKIVDEAEKERPGALRIREQETNSGTSFRIEFPEAPILTPTIHVDADWLIVGLMPQSVEAQLMRIDGRLFSWSIEEDLADSLEILPEDMTSLQVVDPSGTYRLLVGLAPTLVSLFEEGIRKSGSVPQDWRLPFDISQIPPAELVCQPLFLNVSVSAADEQGWHSYTRQSLPGLPLLGGSVGPAASVSSVAVLTALLLPAVQQAREAARRAQSKNNLKQLALAIHNYHDVYNQLPTGTIPNADLDPQARLSWLVSLLPFVDQAQLYEEIDQKQGWEASDNRVPLSTKLPVFLNPSQSDPGDGPLGKTNYIGIGGLGVDGPTLPVTSPKAGFFGYDRVTRFRDVKDGLSNTIMTSDSSEVTPWGEGGRATIRPFTQQPYINGPDGIGSRHTGGVQMGLGDGSVRFISENIDPATLEALTTINGGEDPGAF